MKARVRPRACAGWSGPSLSAYARSHLLAWHVLYYLWWGLGAAVKMHLPEVPTKFYFIRLDTRGRFSAPPPPPPHPRHLFILQRRLLWPLFCLFGHHTPVWKRVYSKGGKLINLFSSTLCSFFFKANGNPFRGVFFFFFFFFFFFKIFFRVDPYTIKEWL